VTSLPLISATRRDRTTASEPPHARSHAVAGRAIRAVFGYEVRDLVRNRWVLAYGAVVLLATDLLLRLGGTGPRALLSMLNVVVALVPLVVVVFATVYWHGARDFVELLLAQPVRRRDLFLGQLAGVVVPLAGAVTLGLVAPMVYQRALDAETVPVLAAFVGAAVALTAVFAAIARVVSLATDDRLVAVGLAFAAWLAATLGWDAALLLAMSWFADWPLDRPVLAATLLNPVDLARVMLVLRLDVAALMGYTGALFGKYLGPGRGTGLAVAGLGLWVLVPTLVAWRRFSRRDF
jgi:Cu-processing system permease protein